MTVYHNGYSVGEETLEPRVSGATEAKRPGPESAEERYQWWSEQPTEQISDVLLTLAPSDSTAEILRGVLRDRQDGAA